MLVILFFVSFHHHLCHNHIIYTLYSVIDPLKASNILLLLPFGYVESVLKSMSRVLHNYYFVAFICFMRLHLWKTRIIHTRYWYYGFSHSARFIIATLPYQTKPGRPQAANLCCYIYVSVVFQISMDYFVVNYSLIRICSHFPFTPQGTFNSTNCVLVRSYTIVFTPLYYFIFYLFFAARVSPHTGFVFIAVFGWFLKIAVVVVVSSLPSTNTLVILFSLTSPTKTHPDTHNIYMQSPFHIQFQRNNYENPTTYIHTHYIINHFNYCRRLNPKPQTNPKTNIPVWFGVKLALSFFSFQDEYNLNPGLEWEDEFTGRYLCKRR